MWISPVAQLAQNIGGQFSAIFSNDTMLCTALLIETVLNSETGGLIYRLWPDGCLLHRNSASLSRHSSSTIARWWLSLGSSLFVLGPTFWPFDSVYFLLSAYKI